MSNKITLCDFLYLLNKNKNKKIKYNNWLLLLWSNNIDWRDIINKSKGSVNQSKIDALSQSIVLLLMMTMTHNYYYYYWKSLSLSCVNVCYNATTSIETTTIIANVKLFDLIWFDLIVKRVKLVAEQRKEKHWH